MRFCIISYSFYEIDYRVRRYAEALVEAGHEVDAIVLGNSNKGLKKQLNGVKIYRIQKRTYNEKNPFDYISKLILFFIKGSLLTTFLHFKHHYEVIHVHNFPDFLIFMAFGPKLFGSKIILDIHDIAPEFFCQKFNKNINSNSAKILLFIEKISVGFSDHVIIANDLWRKKIINRNKCHSKKCTALLNYPKMKFFHNKHIKKDNDVFRIIYPGTISHLHGVDIAIKALANAKLYVKDIKLVIYTRANNSEYFKFILTLIDNLKLKDDVKIYKSIPPEKLKEVYQSSDIGIVPKREGIFSSEAFSTKIFDFMAAGLPIIASKTKIDKYYFDDSIIMFFEPEDHEEFAKCILELYYNKEKCRSLAMRGKQYVVTNNWDVKKKIYLQIVDKLVKNICT